jgi:hypothetical protein
MTVEARFDEGGTDVLAVVRKSETAASEPSDVIEWDSITTPMFDVEGRSARPSAVPCFTTAA